MNVGRSEKQPHYICDKCKEEIIGYHKNSRKHKIPNKYYKADKYGTPKKEFDLCDNCEKRFRKWLETTEPISVEEVLCMFKRCKE